MTKPALILILAAALAGVGAACAPALDPKNAGAAAARFVPVYDANFPDPFILPHQDHFLGYATNAERGQANVQMAVSDDLRIWAPLKIGGKLHDAMPVLPAWAREGWTWAPEVIALDGRYLLYFTARERASNRQCTGVASSRSPLGPFFDSSTAPLICQRELGGTIDASPFRDADGQLYLYFKPDANAVGKPTDIMVQQLTPDGLALTGKAVALLRNQRPWQAHVIESPTMVRHDKGYTLLYSANHFGWEPHQRLSPYAIGYATCSGPMGPCTDAPANPILYSFADASAGCLSGPGHQAVLRHGGQDYLVFHAHAALPGCRNAGRGRAMHVAPLAWNDGQPQIGPGLRPDQRPKL